MFAKDILDRWKDQPARNLNKHITVPIYANPKGRLANVDVSHEDAHFYMDGSRISPHSIGEIMAVTHRRDHFLKMLVRKL